MMLACSAGATLCFVGGPVASASAAPLPASLTIHCFQGGCLGFGQLSGLRAASILTAPFTEAVVCLDATWAIPCTMNNAKLVLAPRFLSGSALIAQESRVGLLVTPGVVNFGFVLGKWQPVSVTLIASNGATGIIRIGTRAVCVHIGGGIFAGPC
jgi:hypothetical protein